LAHAERLVHLVERLAVSTGLQERGLVIKFGSPVTQG
jgi:hypothetical protein